MLCVYRELWRFVTISPDLFTYTLNGKGIIKSRFFLSLIRLLIFSFETLYRWNLLSARLFLVISNVSAQKKVWTMIQYTPVAGLTKWTLFLSLCFFQAILSRKGISLSKLFVRRQSFFFISNYTFLAFFSFFHTTIFFFFSLSFLPR